MCKHTPRKPKLGKRSGLENHVASFRVGFLILGFRFQDLGFRVIITVNSARIKPRDDHFYSFSGAIGIIIRPLAPRLAIQIEG